MREVGREGGGDERGKSDAGGGGRQRENVGKRTALKTGQGHLFSVVMGGGV